MFFRLLFNAICQKIQEWWLWAFGLATKCPDCGRMVVPIEFGRRLDYCCECGWQHKEKCYD